MERALKIIGVFLLYFFFAKVGLSIGAVNKFATLVWAPTGIALASLIMLGLEMWPAVFAGAVCVNYITGAPPWVALGIGSGNALEAVVGALLLGRLSGFRPGLDRLRDALGLVVFGALLSTLLSASVGVGILVFAGTVPAVSAGSTWLAWWTGDLLGDLVVAPLLLVWFSGGVRSWFRWYGWATFVETLIFFVCVFAVAQPVVNGEFQTSSYFVSHHAYLFFPLLIWGALRLGLRSATAAVVVACCLGIVAVFNGAGPFAQQDLSRGLLFLQIFMGTLSMSTLLFAATLAERKHVLKELSRLSNDLKSAVASREDLLAMISHDLKNPLGAVTMGVEILSMELGRAEGQANANLREIAMRVRSSARQMQNLIDDLLDITKYQSQGVLAEKHIENAVDMVEEELLILAPLALSKNLRVELGRADRNCRVNCDRKQVLRVLSNIIGNAIKFTPRQGLIRVDVIARKAEVEFIVTDTGPGIAEHQLEHIFDRYWQIEAQNAGHGLGLYIAKAIVEAHQGRLHVKSRIGEGSSFSFMLPLSGVAEDQNKNKTEEFANNQAEPKLFEGSV